MTTATVFPIAATLALLTASVAAAEPRIFVYGDSNTWGWIPVEKGFPTTRYADDERWPGVMEAALDDAVGDVTVVVDGLSGRTVDARYGDAQNGIAGEAFTGSEDIRAAVASALPLDLVVVMLGTNDARSDLAAEPQHIAASIVHIAHEIRTLDGGVATSYPTPELLVIAPPAIGDTSATPISAVTQGSQARSREISEAIVAAGARAGLNVFDAGGVVVIDSIDGVHMTAPMHEALGKAVAARVGPMINQAE
ncbi:GDSL-type esterase/lipase family protein [Shimia marina]|uniref:GDSL-type esterase/lipase family protein n=1 Tax=Shimia marina TaxID=321267 RepID=UPI0008EB680D|nr:GDSL-type esterase/lipase family protein [Shimia marina]SFE30650.1 Lysophospholipase L1 [Shimia marina]